MTSLDRFWQVFCPNIPPLSLSLEICSVITGVWRKCSVYHGDSVAISGRTLIQALTCTIGDVRLAGRESGVITE